jgi:hypothetical protein
MESLQRITADVEKEQNRPDKVHALPGAQKRGTGGTLNVVVNHHWDRGHPPTRLDWPEADFADAAI